MRDRRGSGLFIQGETRVNETNVRTPFDAKVMVGCTDEDQAQLAKVEEPGAQQTFQSTANLQSQLFAVSCGKHV
jgi:hypothetical protein